MTEPKQHSLHHMAFTNSHATIWATGSSFREQLIGCSKTSQAHTWTTSSSSVSHGTTISALSWSSGLTIKCQFAMVECGYLGYMVGSGKVRPEDVKVNSIQQLHPPTTNNFWVWLHTITILCRSTQHISLGRQLQTKCRGLRSVRKR